MSSVGSSSSASESAGAAPLSERASFQIRRRLKLESELRAARERLAATEAANCNAAETAASPADAAQLQLQSQRATVAYLEERLRPEELRKIGRRVKVRFENTGETPVQLFRSD